MYCFKENGPGYVANLFKPRVTPYNLRSNGLNVVQTSYNSRFLHGSYAYMISHIWNQLPPRQPFKGQYCITLDRRYGQCDLILNSHIVQAYCFKIQSCTTITYCYIPRLSLNLTGTAIG